MPVSPPRGDEAVAAVRRFARYFTRRIGALRAGLYASPFSLVESRVLYEIARRDRPAAGEIAAALDLDNGYLSRILRALARRGLVRRDRARDDARRLSLALTPRGRTAFAKLDRGSEGEVATLLRPLPEPARADLVAVLSTAERMLGAARGDEVPPPFVLRPHRIGDMGAVVAAQARLYEREYGWNGEFEALVAEIVAKFLRDFDPVLERCWIATRGGEIAGSIFLVRDGGGVAKLRLFYLEPWARGSGLAARMLGECLGFARAAGYRRVVLWTNGGLDAARRLYEKAGFVLERTEAHRSFGKDLEGQYWSLDL